MMYLLAFGQGEEVDEKAWASCGDPDKMLRFLQDSGKLDERKLRLFAVAVCRRIGHLLTAEQSRLVVDLAEKYTDGLATQEEVDAAVEPALPRHRGLRPVDAQAAVLIAVSRFPNHAAMVASMFAADVAASAITAPSWNPFKAVATTRKRWATRKVTSTTEGREQATLLRDIFGPLPFRSLPPLPPSARTWNDGLIVKLATTIHGERSLPEGHLDNARLAVLADALEESGVNDADILGHLRQQGAVHVRGCFLLDWLLEKS